MIEPMQRHILRALLSFSHAAWVRADGAQHASTMSSLSLGSVM